MGRILRFIEKLITFFSGHLQGWLIFAMMVLVLVDVTSRYVLRNPLSIAEEFGGYLLVTVTIMGLAFAWQERSHVRVEFLINKLSPSMRGWLRVFTLSLALALAVFTVIAGYQLVAFSLMFGTRSGSWLRTPIAYPQMVIIIGAILLVFQLFIELIKALGKAAGNDEEAG
ncbi:MAG: TRAP transporter small permease [Desulfobacterales bacterium]